MGFLIVIIHIVSIPYALFLPFCFSFYKSFDLCFFSTPSAVFRESRAAILGAENPQISVTPFLALEVDLQTSLVRFGNLFIHHCYTTKLQQHKKITNPKNFLQKILTKDQDWVVQNSPRFACLFHQFVSRIYRLHLLSGLHSLTSKILNEKILFIKKLISWNRLSWIFFAHNPHKIDNLRLKNEKTNKTTNSIKMNVHY